MGRREDIEARMRKLEAEYARLSRFPSRDVFTDGTVITWSRRFDDADVNYNYAAIRANDLWWTTGVIARGQRSLNYDDLLTYIGDSTNVRVIDPDVGLKLDELVIDQDDSGRQYRNRFKERYNVVTGGLESELNEAMRTGEVPLTANPPTGMIMAAHPGAVTYKNVPITAQSGGWCAPTYDEVVGVEPNPESER